MKLFTKAIDSQLFAQYPKGNDLENQKVVAKIFNPYGRGTWYIINSDPNDPDYLWAIVDLFEVEVGSVSRTDLETIKVPPFRLNLERDIYFTPVNAAKLYRDLIIKAEDELTGESEGERRAGMDEFKEGGQIDIAEQNKDMLLNYAEELEHHTEEFEEAAKKAENVEPWVVAKIERATTDLSDVTHYLDSENEKRREYGNGEGEEKEYEEGGEVDSYLHLYKLTYPDGRIRVRKYEGEYMSPSEAMKKMYITLDGLQSYRYVGASSSSPNYKKWHLLKSKGNTDEQAYQELFEDTSMEDGGRVMEKGDAVIYDDETYYITEKDGKVGLVSMRQSAAGSRPPIIDITKIDVEKEVTDMYGNKVIIPSKFEKGGELKWQNAYAGDSALVVSENKMGIILKAYGRKFHLKFPDGTEKTYDANDLKFFGDNDEYAEGGEMGVDKHRIYFSSLAEVIDAIYDIANENGYEVVDIFPDLTYGGISYGQTKKVKVELKWNGKEKVGKSKKRETNTLNVSIYRMDSGNYELVSYFAYKYGGIMAKGGEITVKVGDKVKSKSGIDGEVYESTGTFFKLQDKYGNKGSKFYSTRDFKRSEIKSMASGGKVKFADKVKSIKSSLLKRKKVSPSVQKDYGKTFSPKEAEESAKRIVGAMTAKERLMKKRKK